MKQHLKIFLFLAICLFAVTTRAATHYVNATNSNPVAPFTSWATAATNIQDAINSAFFGETVLVTNGIYRYGGVKIYGGETNRVALTNGITLLSVNGAQTTTIVGGPQIRCAYVGSNSILNGFTLTNGRTVTFGDLTNEESGGGVWCESSLAIITNCLLVANYAQEYGGAAYQGTFNNCVFSNNTAFVAGGGIYAANLNSCVVNSNLAVQFSGGGGGAVYSILNNCAVTRNLASGGGGGASFSTLNNCVVSNNEASSGGGAYSNVLNNCILKNNFSSGGGGGASFSTLNNCVVSKNGASYGGGAYYNVLINCTVINNTAYSSGGGTYFGTQTNSIIFYNSAPNNPNCNPFQTNFPVYCDTTPLPTNGLGDITNDPVFVNLSGGDFHLQTNSACINSGNNSAVTNTTDFDGNPRIVGGTVDIGAYEFQNPSSIISYAYLQQYNLPTDGSADFVDSDGDGFSNYAEWRAGTNPTNAASFLQMTSAAPTDNFSSALVTWQSVVGVTYYLQRSSDLSAPPMFTTIISNIVGQAGTTTYNDPGATNSNSYFYRVGVQ